jgi:DHA1 family multidrug resistance protein-like MFS transporter
MLRQRLTFPTVFDRDLRLLTYAMCVRRLTMGFVMVLRSIYLALLGFSPVEIGLLLSIGTFVSALHHISFGWLSDRYGRKPFLVMGGVFAALRLVIFAVSRDFWMLAVGEGVGAMGEGAGAGQPVVSGYIADKTEARDRGQVFSTLAVTNALASTVGSLLAGAPALFQSRLHLDLVAAHSLLFWLGAIPSVLTVGILLLLHDTERSETSQAKASAHAGTTDWGTIAKFSVVRGTSGLGWGFAQSLMSLYFFTQFSVGGEVLGPIYSLARLISVFSYMLIPAVLKRWGEVQILVGSRLVSAALSVALALAGSYPVAVVLLVALRVAMMFSMPIRQSFATGIVNPRDVAKSIGISSFARMGLRTIAPTVAGYMFEALSPAMPFVSGAVFVAANGLLYKLWFGPQAQPSRAAHGRMRAEKTPVHTGVGPGPRA